ncbi:MAG TPA: hypothetical protein VML75_07500 [Kofleriaceae bacterium]|nr:hypothetical protein [Kofleriaceae bacterium]
MNPCADPGNPCAGAAAHPCAADPCAGNPCAYPGAPLVVPELQPANDPPELEPVPVRAVGVGQRVSFGLAAVDPESDTTRVELIEKPASATYDPITLTVTWTPTRADLPAATFLVRVTETDRVTARRRVFEHQLPIEVTRRPQPVPTAPGLGPEVEALLTIREPERLRAIDRALPFEVMLERAATLQAAALTAERSASGRVPDRRTLYHSVLRALADAHHNPRLDPDHRDFDRAAFGDPRTWQVVAVRPRLDKHWQELRVVYRATAAPEPAYAMFRLRPVIASPAPPEARAYNNQQLSQWVWDAFFDGGGALRPALVRDARAHGTAVAALVERVLTHRDDALLYARGTFVALATGARLGGGSARNPDGTYASGDGWAWTAMKPMPAPNGELRYVNIPIQGFWTRVVPSRDGMSWTPVCAPRFDPGDAHRVPAETRLCRPTLGLVDLPAVDQRGELVSARVDAANLYVEHKEVHANRYLPLRDPRRDHGEENGLTCSQCHTRRFGTRDLYDHASQSPAAGPPRRENKALPTTFFTIVPETDWSPYMRDFQKQQSCASRLALAHYLGKRAALPCELAP